MRNRSTSTSLSTTHSKLPSKQPPRSASNSSDHSLTFLAARAILANVALVSLMLFFYWFFTFGKYIRSNPHSQPLLTTYPSYFSDQDFQNLQMCISQHPMITQNSLNHKNFQGTRGFVIKFNQNGVHQFLSHNSTQCLTPYFTAARNPAANAFVLNVLICEQAQTRGEFAVGLHLDNTVGISFPVLSFLAHQVSVLYTFVPSSMKGGDLRLYEWNNAVAPEDLKKATMKVIPEENTMAVFRGDAYHLVNGFSCTDSHESHLRVSLVLEQYVLPKWATWFTTEFSMGTKSNMTMM
mmetsp:Transcript_92/g.158  ORF Transcript_92/g.158 Transcript_92/m.158 type:complete len:294 (-) Transcript_92:94-975(-)|eukprot:CAMPEP_0182448532 /NCGR_PEP_ID=MMETSP1172-20130603/27901_1 /TAXON_ID=708627 /ORGANISM="Timspurckia oligopyrenoides, Strain CCMP3278" /LENGTH=293 /DNA_ID=CAMNT_0024645441 /DNA_START=165 /DNA_END=1046 /DNA_ORIENTATION=+